MISADYYFWESTVQALVDEAGSDPELSPPHF